MNITAGPPPPVLRDRAVGVVVAAAAADALGAPHEFGPPLPAACELSMTGGGPFGWEPGEWTDDTQTALAVLHAAASGEREPVDAIARSLVAWYRSHPRDVGGQTRAVLAPVTGDPTAKTLTETAARWQAANGERAGNGSLMRTGPVALLAPRSLRSIAAIAARVSELTHPHPDAVDACVLWSAAVWWAMRTPPGATLDWVDLVAEGIDALPEPRRRPWHARLERCRTEPPEAFEPNGWVVAALQAALAAVSQSEPDPGVPACTHLQRAIERAVRAGGDTDTVATIAGALVGARWGATAVPASWRRPLHGRFTYGRPPLGPADLDRLARLAFDQGRVDRDGWPAAATMLSAYRRDWAAPAQAVELVDGLVIGNVHALPEVLADVDAVVSLCRMGREDVPPSVEHHVIGLLDTSLDENPNLDFVLADTADLLAAIIGERKRVFLHCVQAQNRTPAVAAAYLVRHHGHDPDAAVDRVQQVLGARPRSFLLEGVHNLSR